MQPAVNSSRSYRVPPLVAKRFDDLHRAVAAGPLSLAWYEWGRNLPSQFAAGRTRPVRRDPPPGSW